MKKWLTGIVLLLVLLTGLVYVGIPRTVVVSGMIAANCNVNGGFKFLGDGSNWIKWWPGKKEGGELLPEYHGNRYQVEGASYPVISVLIHGKDSVIRSLMTVVSNGAPDSAVIQWECNLDAGINPVSRVRTYLHAKGLRKDLAELLGVLRPFLGKRENVYGLPIREVSTRDSFLLASRMVLPAYPRTVDIYTALQKMHAQIKEAGGMETNFPMMNITSLADGQYQLMVAIPNSKEISGKGAFFTRKLVPGKYLACEVRGGDHTINKALVRLQEYIQDFQLTTMAIPFQSLVTDRSKEADTSRWVTRIYYPVN